MNLRVFSLAAIFLLWSSAIVRAQSETPVLNSEVEERARSAVHNLWQVAFEKSLTNNKPKPKVFTRGLKGFAAHTHSDRICFDPAFYPNSEEEQKVLAGHELAHYLLGHADELAPAALLPAGSKLPKKESWRESQIREECEAEIFSAKLIGKDIVLISLIEYDLGYRLTQKRRAVSFLAAPVYLIIDAIGSLRHRRNEFLNPLGAYQRRYEKYHGPAFRRAILVLKGEKGGCSSDEQTAAK